MKKIPLSGNLLIPATLETHNNKEKLKCSSLFEETFAGIARNDRELLAVFRDKGGRISTGSRESLINSYVIIGVFSPETKIEDYFRPLLMLETAQQQVNKGILDPKKLTRIVIDPAEDITRDPYAALKSEVHTSKMAMRTAKENSPPSREHIEALQTLEERLAEECRRQGPVTPIFYRPPQTNEAFSLRRSVASIMERLGNGLFAAPGQV